MGSLFEINIKYRNTLIILIVFVFSFLTVNSQPVTLQFSYITPDDGLSSSSVTCILQDHSGFMWIGTYSGLNKYNGHDITVYYEETTNPASLPGAQVRSLFEDRDNRLFIGTNAGLSLYNPDYDNFTNFMSDENSVLNGNICAVYNITEDSNGLLYLSTNIGLIVFNHVENTSKIYTIQSDGQNSINNSWIECVFIDSKNHIWVSTRNGLNLFDPESETFTAVAAGNEGKMQYKNVSFLDIAEDAEGSIWISSYNGLFYIENPDKNLTLKRYVHNPEDKNSISGNRLLSIYIDEEDNLWVGSENDGLYLFNRKKQNFWKYGIDDYDLSSLNNESIQSITKDKLGNFWIGTFGGGVNISPKSSGAITRFSNFKGSEFSLSNNTVSSFLEDSKGRLWIGTDGGGLNLFNNETNRFFRYNTSNSGISSNAVLSITEDKKGILWMTTWAGGLVRFDTETHEFKSFTTQNSNIPDNNIFFVEMGYNNDLWLGSYRSGLIHYKIDEDIFTRYNESTTIINNYVFIIKKDDKKNLYIGSTTGLYILNIENDSIRFFPNDENNQQSISNNEVFDILIENDTTVWVATQNGLNRLNPETGIFKRFFKSDGLPGNVVRGLLIDNNRILWVSTDSGICKFDYKNKEIRSFTKGDGLEGNEFYRKSTFKTSDGKLFFGGFNGFDIVDPEKLNIDNQQVPEILITGLDIFNKPVKPNAKGSPLTKSISDTKELILNYNQNILTFYFSVIDYTLPDKNVYEYKLENFDNDWVYAGNRRSVSYTNLDPGKYTLIVRGANYNGVWNKEGVSLKLVIKPPWWSTVLFRIFLGVVIIGLIILFFYYRTSTLRRQKKLLSQMVEERTHDLNHKNELLKQQSDHLTEINTQLRQNQEIIKSQSEELKSTAENLEEANKELASINTTKDKLFSIIAHDLKNPFNVILGYSDLLISNFNKWDQAQNLEILGYIKESSSSAYNLLENLLHWSRSQRGVLDFSPESINICDIFENILGEVLSFSRKKVVQIINLSNDSNLTVFADYNMLTLICRNLLMNAIKFSNSGSKVYINALEKDNFIQFSIADNGIGMDQDKIDSLFNLDKASSVNGTEGEKGTGLGLILCYEFVMLHKG
ncbi:MAG: hypothetical protein JXR31_11195, partial [Prolixibacteraceae bacterium]|nr:hypothetical protein [Prolixibacteraceae bacterium]